MDEHEDSGEGPRDEGVPGTSSEPRFGAVDPLVEGAPIGSGSGSGTDTGARDADAFDAMDEADMGIPVAAPGAPNAWVNAVTAAGLGLMIVELLVLLGTITQGLAVERLDGDLLHKLGVAFLSNVGTANGLTIVAAAVLVALPVLVGAPMTDAQDSRRALALALGAILALVVVFATPIAVRARLHVLDISNQPVDALARRVLGTYTIGTLGTAAVALAACLGLARAGARRPGDDDEDGEDGEDEDIAAPRADADPAHVGETGGGAGASEETVTPHP